MHCARDGARHPSGCKESEEFEHQENYCHDPQSLSPNLSRFARPEELSLRQRERPLVQEGYVLRVLASSPVSGDQNYRVVYFRAIYRLAKLILAGIIGNPMTYVGPDGKQYIAVLSGVGGWSGIGVAANIGAEDPTAGLGALGAFGDVANFSNQGGVLTVFSLP